MKSVRRELSIILCLVMLIGLIPGSVFRASAVLNTGYQVITVNPVDDVTPSEEDKWATITEPSDGSTTYAYKQVDTITAGGEYVIVGNDHAVALMDNNGQMGKQGVTISGTTMTSPVALTEWTFSGTTSGTVYNGTRYLRYNNGYSLDQNNSTNLTFTDNGSNFRISYYQSGGNNTRGYYYFYYSGQNWVRSSRNTTQNVRLYERDEAHDVVVGGTNGYYVKLTGNTTYNATLGMSREDALANVKNQVDVYEFTGSNPGENQGTLVADANITWTLDAKYDGNTPGDYAVTISYNGNTVGTAEVIVPAVTNYYIAEGENLYRVGEGTTDVDALAKVKAGITISQADDGNGTNKTAISDNSVQWVWEDTYRPNTAGSYTVKLLMGETSLGTVEVEVVETKVEMSDNVGYVTQYALPEAPVRGENGSVYVVSTSIAGTERLVEVTVGMLSKGGNAVDTSVLGEHTGLTVTYNGEVITNNFTLVVQARVENHDPEYPDPGAIRVRKTATGIDFQQSGIVQVELSVSGIPTTRGADLIIMLDTSSSMTKNNVEAADGTSKTRAKVLEESLVQLIAQLKAPGEDGVPLDIRVAIADFNGYYGDGSGGTSNTPYDRTAGDYVKNGTQNGSGYQQASQARVYTGNNALGIGAFVQATTLPASYTLNYTSGTNYDYAFDAIYQLGAAAKADNQAKGVERDLFVIFMSDGAALQWNYFGSQNGYTKWNNWITGTWTASDLTTTNLNSTAHSYFYDLNDHDNDGQLNEHRMANAIKGDPEKRYEVIRKSTAGLPAGTLVSAGKDYLYTVPGLGAKLFTINFDAKDDGSITEGNIDKALSSTASPQTEKTQYYYKVTSASQLVNAFTSIGNEVAFAATNARFVDQMGSDFSMQLDTHEYTVVENGQEIHKTLAPVMEVLEYNIHTRQEWENDQITKEQIGDRTGGVALKEGVTFSTDGTKAYSTHVDKDGDGVFGATVTIDAQGNRTYTIADADDNILVGGVIEAKSFFYNTSSVRSVTVHTELDGDVELATETFYWNVGTVMSTELALRYYVYLDGSMEGYRDAGSYQTNEDATLHYTNHLGNDEMEKATMPPTVAWKAANVSYAFYLVNEKGEIIVNQTTGQTGSFANKVAVTNPVIYGELLLNNIENVEALSVAAMEEHVLPKYYTLYDKSASYQIVVYASGVGEWGIVHNMAPGEDGEYGTADDVPNEGSNTKVQSTYVTQYKLDDPTAYSNDTEHRTVGDDYTHTIVWFAVVWTLEAHPDTVVVDYGLPVDIDVIKNDMFGEYGKLAAIGPYTEGVENTQDRGQLLTGFGGTYNGTYGSATANSATGKVRYTLNKENGMEMSSYERFAYAAQYTGPGNQGYYYDIITVIPATTIYYEDNFLTYHSETWTNGYGWTDGQENCWSFVANNADTVQGEDRPGQYSLSDANNIYGYDGAYSTMNAFSNDGYAKATVDYDNSAVAEFDFYGTGYDVIALSSSDTGTIVVETYNWVEGGDYSGATPLHSFIVDTYWGYKKVFYEVTYTYTEGKWTYELGNSIGEQTGVPEPLPEEPKEGDWVKTWTFKYEPSANGDNLYQVPVMQVEGLGWGHYHAKIRVMYDRIFSHDGGSTYDFYLDAIRIYDPANDGAADGSTDTTVEDAYFADGEGWPVYIELRNLILSNESFDDIYNGLPVADMEGLVFIDGNPSVGDGEIGEYTNYGPNNEIYLAPNQRVAFKLDLSKYNLSENNSIVKRVDIGLRSLDGNTTTYTISNVAEQDITNELTAGDYYNNKTYTLKSTTDMYYDLSSWKNDIIVISNTGNRHGTTGDLAITNIKITFTQNPTTVVSQPEYGLDDDVVVVSPGTAGLLGVVLGNPEGISQSAPDQQTTVPVSDPVQTPVVTPETVPAPTVTEPATQTQTPATPTNDPSAPMVREEIPAVKPAQSQNQAQPQLTGWSAVRVMIINAINWLLAWLSGRK